VRRSLRWVLALVAMVVFIAGCGGSDSSDTSAETTETTETTVSTEAEVTSFEVGDLDCSAGGSDGTVDVSWDTSAATAVEISVDEGGTSGFGPSGSTSVDVPCDGETHDITITPLSDDGSGESETESVG
jgi:hypothetical protein